MKKLFLALACAVIAGQGMFAQEVQEITYVEDCSQGYLFNRFKDNWFITAEGGVNMFLSPGDSNRDWQNRWEPQAALYVGKWFSPLFGARLGASWLKVKGLSEIADLPGVDPNGGMVDGKYFKQKFVHIGPAFDAMLNITNWICGYKPGRKYNLTAYLGTGFYWTMARRYEPNGKNWDASSYKNCHDKILMARAGIINTVNLSDAFQLSLDIRLTSLDNHQDQEGTRWNKTAYDLSANLGLTYRFNKREWGCPIVPVCPEPENCDEYRAALQAAEAQIVDLEQQLKNSLARPVEVVEEPAPAPLATIYFPINVYRLTREDIRIVNAVAEVMKATPDIKYVVTGWADNYTGNDRINVALRKNRAASVEKQLLKAGVPASQFTTTINNANLVDMGEKFVALDRATTIQIAK